MKEKLTSTNRSDIIQWDVENWSKCLEFWDDSIDLKSPKKVLAIGEREGGMSLYFALNGHEVICSDYNTMPDTTKIIHQDYAVSERISYAKIDMKAIDLADESVDIVVFKSVIGALGDAQDQAKAVSEIYRVLKKDDVFLFAENLTGSKIHRYLRKKFVSWGERWRYVTAKEMSDWGSRFQTRSTQSYGVIALFGRSEKQRKFLAHLDRFLTPITPSKWRYILFGVFKK
jgi:ubiquinone/menaquinone biosynthesis C-methylase UbiE